MTVYDLQELELSYAPPYGSAKDPVNMAGYVAGNILQELVDPILWNEVDSLENETIILDVREPVEVDFGKIAGSVNIPLNSLRERMNEFDKDKEIVVYCAVGLRGYIASRILTEHGFKNIKNLAGGYKLYSAVQDDKNIVIKNSDHERLSNISNPEDGEAIGEELKGELKKKKKEKNI